MTENVLANRALRHAKLTTITSLDEDSEQAALINEILPDVMAEALEEQWDWSFARRRRSLSMIPVLTYGLWDYAYSLPDDMVQVRFYTVPDSKTPLTESEYELFEYRDDADQSGSRLASNLDEVDIVYTGLVATIPNVPIYFANALSWLLAHYLADAFGGTERAVYCLQMFQRTIMIARGKDDQRERQSTRGTYTLLED
jgi:hypothetical protein